jgi:tetratricopeptide (TPR) repeat protein
VKGRSRTEAQELLERHEALGAESDFLAARRSYERALGDAADARLRLDYGYLLFCHGRHELRRAIEQYVQAIELDPAYDKPHFQLIAAYAGLGEPELAVAMYERRARVREDARGPWRPAWASRPGMRR